MSITEGETQDDIIVRVTGKIITAYVTNNRVDRLRIGELIESVRNSLAALANGEPSVGPGEALRPAVPIKRSVTPDYLICLEDGARLKMLKRHLRTHYGLSPQEYREKWSLPADYPMVAPNYAAKRSELARQIGLGGPEPAKRRKRS
ncbi:MAG: MucR family transcriptional regulator [Alphaproteobacteria bacterium]